MPFGDTEWFLGLVDLAPPTLRPALAWLIDCAAKILGMSAMGFYATAIQTSFENGAIYECSMSPSSIRPRGLAMTLLGLIFIPGVASTLFNFVLNAYLLATMIASRNFPCVAYAILPPGRLLTWADFTNIRAMVWVVLSIFADIKARLDKWPIDSIYKMSWSFVVHSCLCLVPRLVVGARAEGAHGGNMIGYRRRAAAVGVFYNCTAATLPSWVQWLLHYLQPGAPFPHTLAGGEWCAISALVWYYGYPPAVAFGIYHFAEVIVHTSRRRMLDHAVESSFMAKMRTSFLWFARAYLALYAYRQIWPDSFRLMVIRSTWGLMVVMVIVWVYMFDRQPRSFPRESEPHGPVFRHKRLILQGGRDTFRLLRVSPALRGQSPVKCDLIQVPLSKAPQYYTISYRWPSGPSTSTITINDQKLLVHPEVESILKDVRQPFTVMMIWIDQICINQTDEVEKSLQVTLMGEIYRNCVRVFACIPRADINSHGILSTLRRMIPLGFFKTSAEQDVDRANAMIYRLRDSRQLHDFSPDGDVENLIPLGKPEEWQSLYDLLSHEWFSRVWVIQEAALVPRITFRYGNFEIDWHTFVLAMTTLSRTNLKRFHEALRAPDASPLPELSAIDNILVRESLRRRIASGGPLTVFQSLVVCLRFHCGFHVDKVYGLLGIVDPADMRKHNLNPDYTLSPEMLFKQVARSMIQNFGLRQQMMVLRFAGMRESSEDWTREIRKETGKHRDHLPSWAPNWAIPLEAAVLEHRQERYEYKASPVMDKPMSFGPRNPDILIANGFSLDTITKLIDISTPQPVSSRIYPFEIALNAARQVCPKTYAQTSQPIDEAFWRTIIADTHPIMRPAPLDFVYSIWRNILTTYEKNRQVPDPTEPQIESMQDTYRALTNASAANQRFVHLLTTHLSKTTSRQDGEGVASVLHRDFDITHVLDPLFCAGRMFAVTTNGYIGLVPKMTRLGDEAVILHGASTPHILRSWGETGYYELVGEAYVHGFMDGKPELTRLGAKEFRLR